MSKRPPRMALLGYGEAGSAFGKDLLSCGVEVRVYDPAVTPDDPVDIAADEADAARGTDVILSVNCASSARQALANGLAGVGTDAVWVDMNTASPQLKEELAEAAGAAGILFADIAIMAPVPGKGLGVPMLVSGPAAERVANVLGALGTSIAVEEGPAGAAARRKLLRSVFFKGMAAAVVEALDAARAAGCEEWIRENIAAELCAADEGLVEHLLTGSRVHAKRRADEMAASAEMLAGLGVEPIMARASETLLRRLQRKASEPANR